jgi:DNA-binding beta-propeller fold protein YncE
VDEAGNFYLLDSKSRKVFVYDISKEFVAEFDIPEAINPFDIAVKKNKIWITDVKNNRVYVLNASDYSLVDYLPKEKGEVGDESYLYQPYSIAASDEYVVVVDMGAFNVKVFSYEGEFIRNIGSFGRASGQFSRPKGIAIDKEGFIYVVDHAFQNIQIFNTEGQLLMFFGFPLGQFTGLNLPADIAIDYDNIEYFKAFVDPKYELQYLVYVTSQFGDNKVSIFGRIEPKEPKE